MESVPACDGAPSDRGLTLYHSHGSRSSRVLLAYLELRRAARENATRSFQCVLLGHSVPLTSSSSLVSV